MKRKIIITGSSGFIGRELTDFFIKNGCHVYAFQRKPLQSTNSNITYVKYNLEKTIEDHYFQEADFLIHTAYQTLLTNENDVNYSGTKKLIKKCKMHHVNFIFLSTVSAQKNITSRYAKSKMSIERLLNEKEDLILKLGLVIGNHGLFFRMYSIIQKFKIIPIFDQGKQHVQYIGIEDVILICNHVITYNIKGDFVITNNTPILIKKLYQKIAIQQQKKRKFISFPSSFAYRILKITETLKIPLPITSENILGLQKTTTIPQKLPIGISNHQLKSLEYSLQALQSKSTRA